MSARTVIGHTMLVDADWRSASERMTEPLPRQIAESIPCCARRREAAVVLAVLVAATCLFYYEVVFLGRTLLPLDIPRVMPGTPYGSTLAVRVDPFRQDPGASAWHSEPMARKVGHEWAAGRFPLWNEHQGFGAPLLADAQSGGLDLLRLPVLVGRGPLVWDLYYLSRSVLGGLAAYVFARSLGLVIPAGLVFALAYVFSGHFMVYGNNMWIEAYLLLPVLLLGVDLTVKGRMRPGFAMTSAAIGLDLLVGMPESTLFVLLLGAAYGAYRLGWLAYDRPGVGVWTTRFVWLAAAGLVGVALAAPLVLTLFEYLARAHHAHGPEQALGLRYTPLSNLVVLGIPYLLGNGAHVDNYVGMVVLVLAFYGVYPSWTRVYQRMAPFAILAASLLLAKTYGVPGINELGLLPALDITLIPKWSAPVTSFCIAWLASLGVHRLLTEKMSSASPTVAILACGCLTLGGVSLNWEVVSRSPIRDLVATAGTATYLAGITWVVLRWHRPERAMLTALACVCLVVVELFSYAPRGVYDDRYDPSTEPPFIPFLKSQQGAGPFRVFATGGVLYPNSATTYGISDIRALDALYVDRYFAYVQNFIAPTATDRFTGASHASTERGALFRDNPWFDLTGVSYVLTPADGEGFAAEGMGFTGQYEQVYADEVRIYSNRRAYPRTFLVGEVKPVADMEAAIAMMKDGGIDPARSAVVEGIPLDAAARLGAYGGVAAIREYRSDTVVIDIDAASPSLLVLTDAYFPGWTAAIDGQAAPIYPTNLAFRGIFVPAGRHEVHFLYRPATFSIGLVIALIAVLALVVAATGVYRWHPRPWWRLRAAGSSPLRRTESPRSKRAPMPVPNAIATPFSHMRPPRLVDQVAAREVSHGREG